jgi:hypothetical protein
VITMDLNSLWAVFVSTSSPLLPGGVLARWALPLFWSVVLVFAVLYFTKSLSKPRGKWLALIVAAWALVPGPWSPTYWLGLAFQLPSLMAVGLCAGVLVAHWRSEVRQPFSGVTSTVHWLGILLGWLLLLDTFVVLPFSLYRWGYSPAMLALLAVIAAVLWALARERSALWVLIALALFVATRLPSGNVFDAVIDPWLWFALQFSAFKNWRAHRKARSLSWITSTRATRVETATRADTKDSPM